MAAWSASPNSMVLRASVLDFAREHEVLRGRLLDDVERIVGQADDDGDIALAALILRTLGKPSRAADLLGPLVPSNRNTPL